MEGFRDGFVPRANNIRCNDVPRDTNTEVNEVVVVAGGSVISAITGSKGASTGGTEISRPRNSGAENDSSAWC